MFAGIIWMVVRKGRKIRDQGSGIGDRGSGIRSK
jgi:hypothetical protein